MRKRIFAAGLIAAMAMALVLVMSVSAQRTAPGDRALFAVMNGANEIGSDGERGAGDRNGRGAFSAILDGRTLCYGIQVKNIADPSAAHIHRGSSRVAGPVVQALEHPEDGDPGSSDDCVRLSSSLARAIARNPDRYYVNVHNSAFPDGAVRGQLVGDAD